MTDPKLPEFAHPLLVQCLQSRRAVADPAEFALDFLARVLNELGRYVDLESATPTAAELSAWAEARVKELDRE